MTITRRSFAGLVLTGAIGAPSLARAADKLVLAVGQRGAWDTSVSAHALEQGFFKDEGLDVEIIWTQGSAEQIQAVITGSSQIGIGIGTTGALAAFKRNAPIRVVTAKMTGLPDNYWYVRAESPVKSMKDMDGRSMSYSRPGSSSHIEALLIARNAGVTPKFISTGTPASSRTLVMTGQVDAGFSLPPLGLELIDKGEARIVATQKDAPEIADVTARVNIANSRYLASNRAVVERFFKVYGRTIDWMYANPTNAIPLYAKMNDVSPELARRGADFYPKSSMALAPVKGLDVSLQQAIEFKIIDSPMTLAEAEKMIDLVVR